MSITLTLKNIPPEVYARLEAAAQASGRSLEGEAIACLQAALMPGRVSVEERLQRIQTLLDRSDVRFDHDEIAAFRREGLA